MERGTDWEREAVRRRWQALEEQRRATDRFLRGLLATVGGLLLLFLAGAREACSFTVGGAAAECTTVGSGEAVVAMGLVGTLAIVYGLWQSWAGLRG